MKVKKFISLLMCIIMIASLMPVYSNAQDNVEIIEPQTDELSEEYAEDQVIFLYTQTVENKDDFCGENNINDELSDCGITELKELPVGSVYDTKVKNNSDGTYTKSSFFIGYTDSDAETCCEKVEALSSTNDVSLNYYMHEDSISMPIEITSPTSLYNTYTKWWMEDSVHIPEAWQQYDTLGKGSVVAVIDSGVYVDNPEIADNIYVDASGNRGYNGDTLSNDTTPATSHGGNVTGIIAGKAGANRSIIGVAPESTIMAIKVSQSPLAINVSAVIVGINYAIANGADVITMSLSTTSNLSSIKNACDAAYNAGITVISSAGNSAKNTTASKAYPASYDSVIGVMAYGKDGQLCSFSNYDSTLEYYDVAAPGEAILGLPMSETATNSCTAVSGTSQATPIVAGLAALYYSIYPDHTPEEFKNALIQSSTETVPSNSSVTKTTTYYFPKVNALNLLGYYDTAAPSVEAFAGTPTTIDDSGNFIYGLEEGYGSIDDYVSISNGDCEFIPTENGNGTGSILRVYYLSGEVYKDYEIVVFGDTDGDAICDGMDSAFCQYVLDGGTVSDSVQYASDVDFDGNVTQTDLDIITGCGLKADFVTQIR